MDAVAIFVCISMDADNAASGFVQGVVEEEALVMAKTLGWYRTYCERRVGRQRLCD